MHNNEKLDYVDELLEKSPLLLPLTLPLSPLSLPMHNMKHDRNISFDAYILKKTKLMKRSIQYNNNSNLKTNDSLSLSRKSPNNNISTAVKTGNSTGNPGTRPSTKHSTNTSMTINNNDNARLLALKLNNNFHFNDISAFTRNRLYIQNMNRRSRGINNESMNSNSIERNIQKQPNTPGKNMMRILKLNSLRNSNKMSMRYDDNNKAMYFPQKRIIIRAGDESSSIETTHINEQNKDEYPEMLSGSKDYTNTNSNDDNDNNDDDDDDNDEDNGDGYVDEEKSFILTCDDFGSILNTTEERKINNENILLARNSNPKTKNKNIIPTIDIFRKLKDQMRIYDKPMTTASIMLNSNSGRTSRKESLNISKREQNMVNMYGLNTFTENIYSTRKKQLGSVSLTENTSKEIIRNSIDNNNNTTTNSNNVSQISRIIDEDLLFPEWMKKHPEFQEAYTQKKRVISRLIPDICNKESAIRTEEDKKFVMNWLKKIYPFKQMPPAIVKEIANKCITRTFQPGEYIYKQGDYADSLFIVYDGLLDILINNKHSGQAETGEVIGKIAFEHTGFRTTSLVARTSSILLILMKTDYEAIIASFMHSERLEYANLIKNIKLFQKLDGKKLYLLQNSISGRFYAKNEVVYEKDEIAENFYILKEGSVQAEVCVDIERENVWPLVNGRWHKKKVIRTVAYRKNLYEGAYFGEIEIIRNIKRLNKIVANEDAYLLILHKSKFFEIFDADDLKRFNSNRENYTITDLDTIKKEVSQHEEEQKLINDSLITTISKNIKPPQELKDIPKVKPILNKLQNQMRKQFKDVTCKVHRKEEVIEKLTYIQPKTSAKRVRALSPAHDSTGDDVTSFGDTGNTTSKTKLNVLAC